MSLPRLRTTREVPSSNPFTQQKHAATPHWDWAFSTSPPSQIFFLWIYNVENYGGKEQAASGSLHIQHTKKKKCPNFILFSNRWVYTNRHVTVFIPLSNEDGFDVHQKTSSVKMSGIASLFFFFLQNLFASAQAPIEIHFDRGEKTLGKTRGK